ncbi:MAG: AraC family transcriptional activator of pobA [Ulvibacter sp.]|jgi:AraC family transcriptional activator of pobA
MEILDNRKGKMDFRVQKMDLIYEQSKGKIDVAHRHDYFTVLLIEKAKGSHTIDYNKFPFKNLEVHFVSPGQVHQVALTQKPKGSVITFSKNFLVQNNIPVSFISNISLFQTFGNTPPLKIDTKTFERLKGIISEMESCLFVDLNYTTRAVGALLQLFLIYCNNSSKMNISQINEDNAGICIFRDFKTLIEDKFKEWHKVKYYATEIHISPKHLSQMVKNITGKVAKEHIQDRLILEAKRLLLHTELTIKEIAYQIGFEEPLHFSSFFKKKTGISPSLFRNSKKG